LIVLPTACSLAASSALAGSFSTNFDQRKPSQDLASEWLSGFYGSNGDSAWKVEADKEAPSSPNVLKRSGSAVYSWMIRKGFGTKNGFVEAKIRIASGKDDPEARVDLAIY